MVDRPLTRPPRRGRPSPARSGLLRRFARAQEGATAVEFAFVAIPFLMMVFAIIELGLVFLVSMTLENALATVDRKIRTGEFQTTGGDAASFQAAVCKEMAWLETSCPSAITLDVRVLPSFADSQDLQRPPTGKTCWNPGGHDSIVLVRGYYRWPVITPLLRSAVDASGGDREISIANVFTNEPYGTDPVADVKCPE